MKRTKHPFDEYKVGDDVTLTSETDGGEEYKFTVVGVSKDVIEVQAEDGRIATLSKVEVH